MLSNIANGRRSVDGDIEAELREAILKGARELAMRAGGAGGRGCHGERGSTTKIAQNILSKLEDKHGTRYLEPEDRY